MRPAPRPTNNINRTNGFSHTHTHTHKTLKFFFMCVRAFTGTTLQAVSAKLTVNTDPVKALPFHLKANAQTQKHIPPVECAGKVTTYSVHLCVL